RTLLSITPILLPDATYQATTVKIPITTAPGSTTTSISDGLETVTFDHTMTGARIGSGWTFWGGPPNTESLTPNILSNVTVGALTLTLSHPTAEFGVEMETNTFGTFTLTADFFSGPTLVGTISRAVTSATGPPGSSLLFAGVGSQSFDRVVLTAP